MKISSSAFDFNQTIPSKYTCDGENVNPSLQIADIPENAESLVLIVDDQDAPAGTWTHWTIWNITPHIKDISENSVPNRASWDPDSLSVPLLAMEGLTDFGKPGYGGPCPPSGTHRYFFKLYALDTILDLPLNVKADDIEKAMTGHILDKAEVIGLYKRQ